MTILSSNAQDFLTINSSHELVIQVHGGVFHSDDVAVVALLKCLLGDLKVIRDFKVNPDADIVADVGMRYDLDGDQMFFDHHQDLDLRADGTKPSALGLVADWLLSPALRAKLDRFITPVERQDNGQELRKGEVNYFSFVACFNSCWNEGISQDTQFQQAVEMATACWKRILFASLEAEAEAEAIVAEAIATTENGFAVLSKGGMPWQKAVVEYNSTHEEKILRVGYKDLARGQFNVQAVPDALGSKGMLQPLPESWLTENKPEGLIFCHQARFLAAFKSEGDARKALAAEA